MTHLCPEIYKKSILSGTDTCFHQLVRVSRDLRYSYKINPVLITDFYPPPPQARHSYTDPGRHGYSLSSQTGPSAFHLY
jgi:hypothetical protein